MESFKVGDVVQLKSGGPWMTIVSAITGPTYSEVSAVWFDDKMKKSEARFPVEAIKYAEETPEPENEEL